MKKPWFEIDDNEVILLRQPKRLSDEQRIDMCIEKFQALLDSVSKETNHVNTGAYQSCPLCWKYIDKGCAGCPIDKKSGSSGCGNTPYEKLYYAVDAKSIRSALRSEIKFLKSLEK